MKKGGRRAALIQGEREERSVYAAGAFGVRGVVACSESH
jgi:hypothetical protein